MKMTFQTLFFYAVVFVVLCSQGCKEEQVVVIAGLGSLYDPNIYPAVIYSYPENNSVGPYSGLYPDINNYYTPHFRIQFNKLMKTEQLTEQFIVVSGFSVPVKVVLINSSTETGIYNFMIQKKGPYDYYDYALYNLKKTYSVKVLSTLEDIHGHKLGRDYQFSFTPGNKFLVTSTAPKDSFSSGSSQIRLNFNSAVNSSIFSKLSILPAIAGEWYITNNGLTVAYSNSSSFYTNTQYTVTLAASAMDIDSNVLGSPYSFTVKSGVFRVNGSSPSNGSTDVSLNYRMYFSLNSSLNPATLPQAFSISPAVDGTLSNYSSSFEFLPREPLKERTEYTVIISTALQSYSGGNLIEPYKITFTTQGFQLNQIIPDSYEPVSRFSNIEMRFNTRVDTTTIASGITISPSISGKYYFSNKQQTILFRPDSALKPNTDYSVKLNKNLKSKNGWMLDYPDYTYQFKTGE